MSAISGSLVFTISDVQLDFEDINNSISLVPTKIIRRGEFVAINKCAPYDIWSYEVKIKGKDVMNELNALLCRLSPYLEYIRYINKCYTRVGVDCYFRSEFAQFGFELISKVIEKAALFGFSLNFHIFSFGEVEQNVNSSLVTP